MGTAYEDSVFINCPFDDLYQPLFQAIFFAVHDCGLVAHSALEMDNGAEVRIDKIVRIIGQCGHGIHDISRVEPDRGSGLPRMNMPFELGLFLGAQRYGNARQKEKTCIIFDRHPYRYQQFLSDIAGQDIRVHAGDPGEIIRVVRNALVTTRAPEVLIHSGKLMVERYARFVRELPELCAVLRLDPEDLGHRDLARVISHWLRHNPGTLAEAA